ncbi:MAG: acetate kinase [Lentisphaeria bacterium]
MKVLVINSGSSSLKFTMYRMGNEQVLAKGLVERIGLDKPQFKYERHDGLKLKETAAVRNHEDALHLVCEKLVDPKCGVLHSLSDVQAVGHRVLHGGSKMTRSVLVDEAVRQTIRDCIPLGPLHNPANLAGIEACEKVFPGVKNVAVFDTAFHQTMPPAAYLYAIPYEFNEKYGIRKYGFHGTSHRYVCQATAEFLGVPAEQLKMIICHLGNGSSLAAIKNGKVIDTSMGLTPLDGLVMGTRCGLMDPAVVISMIKLGMSADEVDTLLNKKSGLLALAGIGSGDMRDVLDAATGDNEKAKLALEMFVYRLTAYLGAYYASLGGVDAIVFTGGIGENSVPIRGSIMERLTIFGCHLDETRKDVHGTAAVISTPDSRVKAVVMPTNEELMIARDTVRVVKAN